MCVGGYDDDGYDDNDGRTYNHLIFVYCPRAFVTRCQESGTFIELKRWARSKFKKSVVVSQLRHVWILAPQPGCENDVTEL